MQDKTERWLELCARAATEQDADKLMVLIKEITELLDAKERRLQALRQKKATATPE
jgi:hypothetical protein